jgi:predicted dehydrogenase
MSRIAYGIIGCGGIAQMHAEAIRRLADLGEADLVAVCDTVPEKARALAARYDVPHVFTDARQLLQSGLVEAVSVCTPHPSHCPLAILCAEHRVHVIVEKPLSVDLREADRAIAAARRAGIRFGVIFQRRFWPAAQRAHQAIAAGKLGRIILGDCLVKWYRPRAYYERDPWRGRWDSEGGGVLVNQAVHAIDMFQWLMGPVETVFGFWANLTHPYIEVEDTAVAALRFRNGALGVISTSVSITPQLGARITIHGENGATISILEHPEGMYGVNDIWTIPGEEAEAARILAEEQARGAFMFRTALQPDGQRSAERNPECHMLQLRDFLQAIRENRDPLVTAEEGRKSIEIIQAIYESGRTGRPVHLPLGG